MKLCNCKDLTPKQYATVSDILTYYNNFLNNKYERTDKPYYTYSNTDGNEPELRFVINTQQASVRIPAEVIADGQLDALLSKACHVLGDKFLTYINSNTKEGYKWVIRQNIKFKVFVDNFSYDLIITAWLRCRSVPIDPKTLLEEEKNSLKREKGHSLNITIIE